jgi:hypothetical protein
MGKRGEARTSSPLTHDPSTHHLFLPTANCKLSTVHAMLELMHDAVHQFIIELGVPV